MLINENLAGKTVATGYGKVTFDANGENNELDIESQKKLGNLPKYRYKEEKQEKEKAQENKKEDNQEEAKEQDKSKQKKKETSKKTQDKSTSTKTNK